MSVPYIRKMVVLNEELPAYRANPARPAAGRALLEADGSKGRITVSAQNLRPGTVYKVYLIQASETESVGMPIGILTPNEKGKADARLLFDAGENAVRIQARTIVAIFAPSDGTLVTPLAGAVDETEARKIAWRANFTAYTFPKPDCGGPNAPAETLPAPPLAPTPVQPVPEPEPLPPATTRPAPPLEPLPVPVEPEPLPPVTTRPAPPPEPLPVPVEPEPLPPATTRPAPPLEPLPVPVQPSAPEDAPEVTRDAFFNLLENMEWEPADTAGEAPAHAETANTGAAEAVSPMPEAAPQSPHARFAEAVNRFHAHDFVFIPAPEGEMPPGTDAPPCGCTPAPPETDGGQIDVWQLFESNTPMQPFERQNADVSWVRLSLDEFSRLPFDASRLAESEFVREQYDKYRHLIFGKLSQGILTRFILGVPGMYREQERRAAARLGFRQFKTLDGSPAATDTAGYWLLVL